MQGSRLYGKPLQNLDLKNGVTILDQLVDLVGTLGPIQTIVLGIAEGSANVPFAEFAARRGLDFVIGDEKDVLGRLISCGHKARATDIFRVTTECPYFYHDLVETAWEHHLSNDNDVTTVDGLPEGCHFEIYTLESLERSQRLGDGRHRSEYCSLYIREHRADFKVEVLPISPQLERLDLRLSVDYPEDLIVCRRVYEHQREKVPRFSLAEIINFLDDNPGLRSLVAPYVVSERLW